MASRGLIGKRILRKSKYGQKSTDDGAVRRLVRRLYLLAHTCQLVWFPRKIMHNDKMKTRFCTRLHRRGRKPLVDQRVR